MTLLLQKLWVTRLNRRLPTLLTLLPVAGIKQNPQKFDTLLKFKESLRINKGQTDIHFLKRYSSIPFYVNILINEYRKIKTSLSSILPLRLNISFVEVDNKQQEGKKSLKKLCIQWNASKSSGEFPIWWVGMLRPDSEVRLPTRGN